MKTNNHVSSKNNNNANVPQNTASAQINPTPVTHSGYNSQDVMKFADGSRGVVFYRDGEHGLVVSLDEASVQWQNNGKKNIRDIMGVPNGDFGLRVGQGMSNTQAIISEVGLYNAPATRWCVEHGDGWYLPSVGEMKCLIMAAKYGNDKVEPVNNLLIQAGGQPLLSKFYWTSSEDNGTSAYKVARSGASPSEYKYEEVHTRAIRQF